MKRVTEKMYNLLVHGDKNAWVRGEVVYELDRYLEYTDDVLRARLEALNPAVVSELTGLPALFAYEQQVGAPARIGWITGIEKRQRDVRVTYKFDQNAAPVPVETLQALVWPLKIEDWELNRTHWAVKSVDLFHILNNAAGLVAAARTAKGEYKFGRQTILKACDILKTLGHADLDRFLLEVGIEELRAGRDRGSRAQRTNAMAEYVLGHSDDRTAEGEVLSLAIVREAAKADPTYPERPPRGLLDQPEARRIQVRERKRRPERR